jgi:hypothetical protein
MTRDHGRIEELLAVRALGGLDGDDRDVLERELADHGDCAECRELERSFSETAGRLAFALDPEPVDPTIAERILAAPREAHGDDASPGTLATSTTPPDEVAAARERRRRPGWRTLVAVAAAFALVVVVGAVVTSPRTTGIGGVSAAQTFVRFEGEGALAMAFVPGRPGAAFVGTGLPDPGPGNLYEIWLIRGETPVSGGCVTPTDGTLVAFIDADVSQADLMALTIEPTSCPSQPTSAPFSTAPLPSA